MAINSVKDDEESTYLPRLKLIGRLFSYLKKYYIKVIIVIILLLFVSIINVLAPLVIKLAIDRELPNNNTRGLLYLGGILIFLYFISMIMSILRIRIMTSATANIMIDIRRDLYTHIQTLSFGFFDNRPVGKVLARVIGDVNALKNLFDNSITNFIPQIFTLVFVTIAMLVLNLKLAIAAFTFLPILIIGMYFINIKAAKIWAVYRKKRSNLNAYTHESFSGIKVIQSFSKEKSTLENFTALVNETIIYFISACKINDFFWPLIEISWSFGVAIVYFIGFKGYETNTISAGTLIAFISYISMFWRPVLNLMSFYTNLITNLSAADRIFEIIDINPDIYDMSSKELPNISGDVEFKDVHFSYDRGSKILDNINFKVKAGQTVALVGPTGSGKTTIVNLLVRFYDLDSGKIFVDNNNIKDFTVESLRRQMGIMLQDTFLFSTTIKENIRYGKLGATDQEIIEAAKAVNAHEFIISMEKGYDTEISERGSRLSVGQRQLISFARSLLSNPRILILDEATSNIDTNTELLVQKGLKKLLEGRTSFVIAHRLSTIRDSDIIMVINDRVISQSGTHQDLLKKTGLYSNLFISQYKFLKE